MKRTISLTVLLIVCLMGISVAAQTPEQTDSGCVIPESGPWPPCATGGQAPPPSDDGCVIPESGPWPPCAISGGDPPANDDGDCVIPPSGPWPPCATGSSSPPPSDTDLGDDGCVIPESGPWPPCATGGSTSTPPPADDDAPPTQPDPPAPSDPAPPAASPPNPNAISITSWSIDYYNNSSFLGQPAGQEQVTSPYNGQLTMDWGVGAPLAGVSADNFSARLTTQIQAPDAGDGQTWSWRVQMYADNPSAHMYVARRSDDFGDINQIMVATTRDDATANSFTICSGEVANVTVEYIDVQGGANLSFALIPIGSSTDVGCSIDEFGRITRWRGNTDGIDIQKLDHWLDGYSLTVMWETEGADRVNLFAGYANIFDPNANATLNNYPPDNTQIMTLGTFSPFKPRLHLTAVKDGGGEVERAIPINLVCASPWFFNAESIWNTYGLPAGCGQAAQTGAASFQPFENGFMLWVDGGDGSSSVLVFLPDSSIEVFTSDEIAVMQDMPADFLPPDGLVAPRNAFGRVWFSRVEISEELGWATEPETGYQTTAQHTFTGLMHTNIYRLPTQQIVVLTSGIGPNEFNGVDNWRVLTP